MAIYNPSQIFPTSGDGCNITDINRFDWDFNSDNGEVQTNYQLLIYTLDDILVYDSTLLTSSNLYHDVPSYTFTGNISYKWKITTDGKTSNQYAIFKALASGVVTIDTLPFPFQYQFYTFTATYTQAQNIPVKNFVLNLYDNSDVLISTSGEIVSEVISYEFNGLENATIYKVEAIVTNQLNVISTSSLVSFTTDYTFPFDPDLAQVRADIPSGSNVLDWSAVVTQIGSVTGTYSFPTGVWGYCLELDEGSILTYDLDANIPKIFSSVMFLKLPLDFNGKILTFSIDGKIKYEIGFLGATQKFYYKRGNRFTSGMPVILTNNWFRFIVRPDSVGYEIDGYHEVR